MELLKSFYVTYFPVCRFFVHLSPSLKQRWTAHLHFWILVICYSVTHSSPIFAFSLIQYTAVPNTDLVFLSIFSSYPEIYYCLRVMHMLFCNRKNGLRFQLIGSGRNGESYVNGKHNGPVFSVLFSLVHEGCLYRCYCFYRVIIPLGWLFVPFEHNCWICMI